MNITRTEAANEVIHTGTVKARGLGSVSMRLVQLVDSAGLAIGRFEVEVLGIDGVWSLYSPDSDIFRSSKVGDLMHALCMKAVAAGVRA